MKNTFNDLDAAAKAALARSVFVIYDTVARSYIGSLIVERHPAPVVRLFHQLLADQQTQLSKHPGDYNVFHIGYIEDSGQIWPIDPTIVATGSAWAASQTPEVTANA